MLDLSRKLKLWRKAEGISQQVLAFRLGISQQAVSHWERGLDVPNQKVFQKLQTIMAVSSELNSEVKLIERQLTIRALFEIDGIKLITTSKGFNDYWPNLASSKETPLADFLVNEAASLYATDSIHQEIKSSHLLAASGVSERHMSLSDDGEIKHRWFTRFRHYGHRIVADMIFEPCSPNEQNRIEMLLRKEDLLDI